MVISLALVGGINMGRMVKPEMEVVRFTEADIITASSDSFSLSNFGGTLRDGTATYRDVTYYGMQSTTRDNDIFDFMKKIGNSTVISNGDVNSTMQSVVVGEYMDGLSGDWDGTYVYDASSGSYRRSQS